MFRAHVLIIIRWKLHYTASGIITPIGGRLVHRLTADLYQPLHETATYRCDDTRGCVMQFWPYDDEHMCSEHVEAWNKLIVKQIFCAWSWLITDIDSYRFSESLIPSVTVLQIVRKCQQLYSNCKIIGHVVQLFSPSIFVADIPLLISNKLSTRESRLFSINAFVTRNKENASLWKALLAVAVFWISLPSYHANNRSCHTCWLPSLFFINPRASAEKLHVCAIWILSSCSSEPIPF